MNHRLHEVALPQIGDVVLARHPFMSDVELMKRVDDICVESRRGPSNRNVLRARVTLLGDNPGASTDSRSYGPVPLYLVRSKVVARIPK